MVIIKSIFLNVSFAITVLAVDGVDPTTIPFPKKSVRFDESVTVREVQKDLVEKSEDLKDKDTSIPLRSDDSDPSLFICYSNPLKNRLSNQTNEIIDRSIRTGEYPITTDVLIQIQDIIDYPFEDLVYQELYELVTNVHVSFLIFRCDESQFYSQ